MMLQQDNPQDYVIATGQQYSVREFIRWSAQELGVTLKFVQGDEDLWNANTKKFTEATGVEVRIDNEAWEDVRPKAAVAANVGSGPDIILGWFDDPHQYPDKLVPLTDLADYLGNKYGGWYDAAQRYGMKDGEWIGLPLGAAGACMVYRQAWVQEARSEEHTSELQSLMRSSYAVFRLKKKKDHNKYR